MSLQQFRPKIKARNQFRMERVYRKQKDKQKQNKTAAN